MIKNDMHTEHNKPSAPVQFTEREFYISGKKVRAFFPERIDEKTMSLIKNMLIDAHTKNTGSH